jgi:O-antigen/teichoic acid export membrane protein
MFLAQGFAVIVGSGVSIYAIRSLSQSAWGQYSTALALVAVFTVFSGLGVAQLALREMTKDPTRRQAVLAQSLGGLVLTCLAAAFVLGPVAVALGYPAKVLVLIAITAPFLLLEPVLSLAQAAFNSHRWLPGVAGFQAVRSAVYGALAVTALALGTGVVGLAATSLVGLVASVLTAGVLLRRRLGLSPRISFHGVTPYLRAAVPIAGISIVGILYDRLDVVMLSKLASVKAVATYSVPYSFVRLSWLVPSIIAAAFFPILSSALAENRDEARRLFFLVVRLFLFASLPLSLLLAVGSPTLLSVIFGGRYEGSVHVLQIMAWTSVLGFENYVFWYGIFAIHRERLVLGLQIAGLILNAVLNILLIPRFGPSGAAAALVTSDLLVVVGQAFLVHRYLFRLPFARLLLKPATAGALVIPASVLLGHYVSPLGAAAAGALTYAGFLLATSYVETSEWRPLTEAAAELVLRVRKRLPSPA